MTGCYVNTFLSPLSLERETECLKKVAQNDKEAKDELILHNMRLVAHVTKKYAVREPDARSIPEQRPGGLLRGAGVCRFLCGRRY